MKLYRSLFTFALSAFCLVSMGQDLTQTVRGKVIDEQSGAPIFAATVVVENSDPIIGTTTDDDGAFRLENVKVGRHTILISFLGYEQSVLPEVYVGSGKEVILTVKLKESVVKMKEFEVRAPKRDDAKPLNEMATVSAQSFTVEETKQYAASFDDPARAALSFAGVSGGGDDGTNELIIRGNSPRGVLWRVEGIEVPNPNHFAEDGASAGAVSMLSTNVLDNSDFFTGAFPAEYGNALSGVFDINMRTGNNEKREYALQAGILGVVATAEGPFKKGGKSSYLINYRYSTLALFDNVGVDIVGEQEDIIFQDMSFKLNFPSAKMGTLSIWGLGGKSRFTYRASGVELDPNNDTIISNDYENENFVNGMGIGGITHKYYFNPNTYLKTTVAYTTTLNEYEEDSLKQQVLYNEKFNNTSVRTSVLLNRKINARHTIRTGAIHSLLGFDLYSRFRDDETNQFVTDLDRSGTSPLLQYYAQWQFRISDELTMNTGMHSTYFALNQNYAIEPRWGLQWDFSERQSFSAGFGMHSRMETISVYQAHELDANGNKVFPNKDLDFTKARHYVLGHNIRLAPNLQLKSELYYQELYDVPIRPATTTDPFQQSFSALNERDGYTTDSLENNGTGSNYGLEVTMRQTMSNGYYFLLTGSLYESKYKGADGKLRNTRFNGNLLTNFLAGKEFTVGKNKNNIIALNTRFFWAGGKRTTPIDLEASRIAGNTVRIWDRAYEDKLRDYWRLDVGFSYRKNKPKFSSVVSLDIQNVTMRDNPFSEYYDSESDSIQEDFQLGILPILSYRIEF